MLKVLVMEKGGKEQEFNFDSEQISLGRVRGNDVVLAKPNISKRHALIRVVDGKLYIEDLKSTNGTLLNGRRISGARPFEAKDQIQIGDFAITALLAPAGGVLKPATAAPKEFESEITDTISIQAIPDLGPEPIVVEDFDVMLDVEVIDDDDEPSQIDLPPVLPSELLEPVVVEQKPPMPVVEPPTPIIRKAKPEPRVMPAPKPVPIYQPPQDSAPRRVLPLVADVGINDEYQMALKLVSERAQELVFATTNPLQTDFDDREWQSLSDSVMKLIDRLRRENLFPASVDPFPLTQDILFEFVGLGPLEELLADNSVKTITVYGPSKIFVTRKDGVHQLAKIFSGLATLNRVVLKLINLAGGQKTVDPTFEGRLPDGSSILIMGYPLCDHDLSIVINRPVVTGDTLDDLLTQGRISKAALDAINEATSKHRSILVIGCKRGGQSPFISAVLKSLKREERLVLLEERRDLLTNQPNVVSLNRSVVRLMEDKVIPLITRLDGSFVVMPDLTTSDVRLLVGLALSGQGGVISSMVSDSWQSSISKLTSILQFQSPHMDAESAKRFVGDAVNCVIQLEPNDKREFLVKQVVSLDGSKPVVIS